MSEFPKNCESTCSQARIPCTTIGGIETQLRDPGEQDWEENAIRRENDEALVAIGDATDERFAKFARSENVIDDGSFGTCSQCHKSIPKARLEALPWQHRASIVPHRHTNHRSK